jgi:glycine cleavage system aminomethyltransferase T
MNYAKLYSKLLPKMGQYGNFTLPMTFQKFRSSDVVRNTRKPGNCTVFDVSHMGVFETRNTNRLNDLLYLNLGKLKNNKGRLAVILEGENNNRVVDDLIVSRIDYRKYRLVVNANTRDFYREKEYLKECNKTILAIQGEHSQKLLEELTNTDLSDLYFMENRTIHKDEFEICRCGYTGEDGFEIYIEGQDSDLSKEIIGTLVDRSLESSLESNIMFGGLIERDILRLEAGLWLAGNEFSRENPIKFNALNSKFLIDNRYRNNEHLFTNTRMKFISSERPFKGGTIYYGDDKIIGVVTSSGKSFNLDKFIGIGFINNDNNDNRPVDSTLVYSLGNNNKKIPLTIHDSPFINGKYYRK